MPSHYLETETSGVSFQNLPCFSEKLPTAKKGFKMRINVGAYTSNINSVQLIIGSQDFCSLEN